MRVRPAGVLWVAGRPAAGKTSLAERILAVLDAREIPATLLDSDEARAAITPRPLYTAEERRLFYRALAYAARKLSDAGSVAVVAATLHDKVLRRAIRTICPEVFLVHAKCSFATAAARDPKGLYADAREDLASTLPGVGVPYDEPADAAWEVETDEPVPPALVRALTDAFLARMK